MQEERERERERESNITYKNMLERRFRSSFKLLRVEHIPCLFGKAEGLV